jgi:chitodextrinase
MKRFYGVSVLILGFVAVTVAGQVAHAQSAVPPSVPTGISATLLSTQQVYVSWSPSNSTSSIIDGYYLYRNGAFIANTPGYTYYTDTPGAGAFSYTVAAYDVNGNTSAQSTPTTAVTVVGDTTPPTEPTGLTVVPSSSSVTLSWQSSTDNIGVVGYYISRNGVRIQTTDPVTGTSYTDSGLTPGQTYTYTVSAYDASRNVSTAAAIQATTIYDITPPTVPTQVKTTVVSPSEIDLSWQPSTDNIQVSGYNIYQNGNEIATLVGTTTSYASTGLSPQTNYTFNISAYDEVGNTSNESGPVSATTLAPDITPPTFPTYLTATAIDPTDVVLQWNPSIDPDGVAGYYIYRGGTEISTVVGTTTYEDSGLATGTYYIYYVTAYDNAGNVSGPDYASVTTPASMPVVPPVVLPTATATASTTTTTPPPVITLPPTTTTTSSAPTFTTSLYYGLRSSAVLALQNFLISQNDLGPSYNTGFYGSLTQAAVKQFQCAKNIVCSGSPATTGWGSVGPRTRAALNSF